MIELISSVETQDTELVELAGLHAYRHHEEATVIKTDGSEFRVVDTNYDHPTGLDALTVLSVETGEFTVVYVGTATETTTGESTHADIYTDMQLVSDLDVAQLDAAEAYYRKMDEEYGISSVAGNSLGGALANNVAVQHEDVRAVTLNPALLPFNGVMDPDREYNNITNYFSQYDVLTTGISSIGMSDQIPGQVYNINNGIPLVDALASNHTGYVERPDGTHYYEIGTKGEPGYGRIYVAAHTHIVTSIWTGQPLYGGFTDRIDINQSTMETLAGSLKGYVNERLSLSQEYMGLALDIIGHEKERRAERERLLKEQFSQKLEDLQQAHLTAVASGSAILKNAILNALSVSDGILIPITTLGTVLNSPPAKLVDHLFMPNIDLSGQYRELSDTMFEAIEKAGEFFLEAQQFTDEAITELFSPVTGNFSDAVVDELHAHYSIINANYLRMHNHLSAYSSNVSTVGQQFALEDDAVAGAIQGGGQTSQQLDILPTNMALIDSEFLENALNFKHAHVELKFQLFKANGIQLLSGPLALLESILFNIEGISLTLKVAVKDIASRVRSAASTLPFSDIPQLNLYEQLVKDPAYMIMDMLDEFAGLIEGLRNGVNGLVSNLPSAFDEFRSYIDTAIFNDESYLNVQLYTGSASSLLDEMKLLFEDINYQLTDQKANAVTKLYEDSSRFTNNMNVIGEQVQRGTVI